MLWGRHNGIRIQVSIPDNLNPYIEFNAEFPPSFPEDLALWGFEHIKEGLNLSRIANDLVWFQRGENKLAHTLPDNAIAMKFLEDIFSQRPKSTLVKRVLTVRFPGKENTILDKHLKNWLDLCTNLQEHFNPAAPQEDIMETLEGLS